MPKSTFYRLADEKKERILSAAKHEFFSVPYAEVSINKIIKAADIPRGSFYQYFEDKQDLFLYLVSSGHDIVLGNLKKRIDNSMGDFFQFVSELINLFEKFIRSSEAEGLFSYFSDPETMQVIAGMIRGEKMFSEMEEQMEQVMLDKIDFSRLNIDGEDEKTYFIRIAAAAIKDVLKQYFCIEGEVKTDKLCHELRGRVDLLKKVFEKEKGSADYRLI